MKIRALIPTDFTVESLNTLKLVLKNNTASSFEIILLHPFSLGDSISDLLFYAPRKLLRERQTEEFSSALAILKNRYESSILTITIEAFHSLGLQALKNFVQAQGITHIYLPGSYQLSKNNAGLDIVPILKKTTIPFTTINWQANDLNDGGINSLLS